MLAHARKCSLLIRLFVLYFRASADDLAKLTAHVEAAADVIGTDQEWWEFKTRDVLLDTHIVRIDVRNDLSRQEGKTGGEAASWFT